MKIFKDYGDKHRQELIQSTVVSPKVFEEKRRERERNRAAMRTYRMMQTVKEQS